MTTSENLNFTKEVHSYMSPSVTIIDIHSEGILCASGADSFDKPDTDYDPWFDLGEI